MKIKKLFFDSKKKKIALDQRVTIFFFCLLLSTSFWFLAALSKSYTTDLSIPLEYVKMSDDFLLTEEPPKSIKISVNGTGYELLGEQMSLNRSAIQVNLNYARPLKDGLYAIATSRLKSNMLENLDKDLSLIAIKTDSIFLKTQPKVSKLIPVKPMLDLVYKTGYKIRGEAIMKPESVKVSGPKNALDSLRFIETELINEKDVSDTLHLNVGFNVSSISEAVDFNPDKIEIFIPIEKFTEKVFELPVGLKTAIKGAAIRTFPNLVKVVFSVPLSQYENFNEGMLSAEVEYDAKKVEQKKLRVIIKGKPVYAELLRIEPEMVEFIVKK